MVAVLSHQQKPDVFPLESNIDVASWKVIVYRSLDRVMKMRKVRAITAMGHSNSAKCNPEGRF